MKTVSCKIPQDTYKRLQVLAQKSDRKVSYLLREAIQYYMDNNEKYLIAANMLAKEGRDITPDAVRKEIQSKD